LRCLNSISVGFQRAFWGGVDSRGTANTLIYVERRRELAATSPPVVAVQKDSGGSRRGSRLLGGEKKMLGRTPASIVAISGRFKDGRYRRTSRITEKHAPLLHPRRFNLGQGTLVRSAARVFVICVPFR